MLEPGCFCICGDEYTFCIYVASQWTWQICHPFVVCCTKMPPFRINRIHIHVHTSCHLFILALLFLLPQPPTCIITPPIYPARAPMSKPNTTDQQLGMQIMSQDKLCAACQLHTWVLGWLSVTCVRVPLHLRCATIMTWCRVSLPSTPHAISATLLPPQPLL